MSNTHTRALLKVLGRLRDRHPDMTVFQAICFLEIADQPGIGQTELYRRLDSSDHIVSRQLALLSDFGNRIIPGLDLIEARRDDPADRRKRQLYLTRKGKNLMADILADLESASTAARA
jgi:DNA-binding MarR family transcriptional regulator